MFDGLGGDLDAEERRRLGEFLVGGLRLGQEPEEKGPHESRHRELASAEHDGMVPGHVLGHFSKEGLHGLHHLW